MDKFKVASTILVVCLVMSILFNVYFLFRLSNSSHELEESKHVGAGDIGVYWNQWNQFRQQNSNIYYVIADFEIVNYGEMSAYVVVAVEVRHEGQTIYEWFETGEASRVGEPIVRYGYFTVPPGGGKNCSLTFSYWNPENLDTYLFIRIVEAFPYS